MYIALSCFKTMQRATKKGKLHHVGPWHLFHTALSWLVFHVRFDSLALLAVGMMALLLHQAGKCKALSIQRGGRSFNLL